MAHGQIVILNGAPRSGKSSIAAEITAKFPEIWLNLGVDALAAMTPARYRPGIGLRPGGERPDLEPVVKALYAALYESVAAVARTGVNVVVDVGHHDSYARPTHILADCAKRLAGLPVLFVGVMAPIETIMARRAASGGDVYLSGTESDPIPSPIALWQSVVHAHGAYDLTLDTSKLTPGECAAAIRAALSDPTRPTAFEQLAVT